MPAGANVLIPLIAARWSRTGKAHAQGRGRDEDGMKTLLATIIGLAIVAVANPASAYVVAITTSIPAKSVADDADLKAALLSAIDDVLRHAIAFSPTFVTVLKARVVEDRIYILLLIGDRRKVMRRLDDRTVIVTGGAR